MDSFPINSPLWPQGPFPLLYKIYKIYGALRGFTGFTNINVDLHGLVQKVVWIYFGLAWIFYID